MLATSISAVSMNDTILGADVIKIAVNCTKSKF